MGKAKPFISDIAESFIVEISKEGSSQIECLVLFVVNDKKLDDYKNDKRQKEYYKELHLVSHYVSLTTWSKYLGGFTLDELKEMKRVENGQTIRFGRLPVALNYWIYIPKQYRDRIPQYISKSKPKTVAVTKPKSKSKEKPNSVLVIQPKSKKESKQKQEAKSKQIQKPKIKKVFDLDMILYVYVYYPYKYLHGYKIESVRAGLLCIDGGVRYIEAYYCHERNCCFISYYDYQIFQAQYGFILNKVYRVKNDSWGAIFGRESSFNEQSELNLHGYNVGKKDNLSRQERHDILAALLDYGIMNRYSIELYLEQFINLNGAKLNMEDAVQKWKSDYEFVLNYKITDKRSVLVKQMQSGSQNIIVESKS